MQGIPLVSVIVPTYNYGKYIRECIDSILSQTYKNLEIIIIDDASSDNTEEIVKKMRDRRIFYYRNKKRTGNWPLNVNKGIKLSHGDYITVISADDLMIDPQNLERKISILEDKKYIGFVFSQVEVVDEKSQKIERLPSFPIREGEIINKNAFERLIVGNFVYIVSVVCPKEIFKIYGLFSPYLPYLADWEMWLRIAREKSIYYISSPLAAYRMHPRQMTKRKELIFKMEKEEKKILNAYLPYVPQNIKRKAIFMHFWRYSRIRLRVKRDIDVYKYFVRAFSIYPAAIFMPSFLKFGLEIILPKILYRGLEKTLTNWFYRSIIPNRL